MAHGHFGGMQVACLLWQRVCSEKFPSRTSLSGGFGKEAFLCVPLLLGSKRAVSPKCGHEPKIWVRVCRLCPSTLEIREKICVKMRKVMAHPTRCATSCTSQGKWLQMVLHGIYGFGTKWNCCRIARKPRGREGGCWKQTGILCPPDPLRGIGH